MGEPLRAQSGPFRRSGAERSVARGPISFFEGLWRLSCTARLVRGVSTVVMCGARSRSLRSSASSGESVPVE